MLMKYTELRNVKQCLFISEILDGYTQLFISFVNIYIIIYFLLYIFCCCCVEIDIENCSN